MKTIKVFFYLFIIFCLPLTAQETIEERLNIVENIVSRQPKILGNINLRYRYDDTDGANGFDVRRARLDIRGNVTTPLEYRIHLEFANSPKVLDANLSWKINQYLSLMAGQYKIPFSLENPYNPNVLELIENSLVITHLVNYSDVSGVSANGRDVGLSISGALFQKEGYSLISYFFGIYNGSGINTSDNNKAKDFSGIFSVNPLKNLTFAFSYYDGGRVGERHSSLQRTRSGVGVKYDDGKLLMRSEYITGKTKREDEESFNTDGGYVVCGYYVVPKVQAVARCDYFKRDMKNDNTQQLHYTVGCNYFPVNNVRLQFNYAHRMQNDDNQIDNNIFIGQVWVRF